MATASEHEHDGRAMPLGRTAGEVPGTAQLRDWSRVAAFTRAAAPLQAFLMQVAQDEGHVRLLMIGVGDGGLLRRIARWGERHEVPLVLVGVDADPRCTAAARVATPAALGITWVTGDWRELTHRGWDVVACDLAPRRPDPAELDAMVDYMEAEARHGWFLGDLAGGRTARWALRWAGALARWHPAVRAGVASALDQSPGIAAWAATLALAGTPATVRRTPFRLAVQRRRPRRPFARDLTQEVAGAGDPRHPGD